MIIYDSIIPRVLRTDGITIYPFILIHWTKDKCPEWLIVHEKIHLKQQLKWFWLPFFIVYVWDYLVGRLEGQPHDIAYRNIRFEKEAYFSND